MFSAVAKITAASMRPGLVGGCYPERNETGVAPIDLYWSAAKNLTLSTLSGVSDGRLRGIATKVNAAGKPYKDLPLSELQKQVRQIQRQLYQQGLIDELCIEAFALVREIATQILGVRHYDVQVMGAWAMLQGRLAEMQTGEGKTLTATLTAATVALAGIPVHVLTVNEYLVQRDATVMQPLYQALGLSVGSVSEAMPAEQRKAAYRCDICYGTNKQVAFDYLRDCVQRGPEGNDLQIQLEASYRSDHRAGQRLLRGLCFALVDEADSLFIDEARTPLILTRTVDATPDQQLYREALRCAKALDRSSDYQISEERQRVLLTAGGQHKVRQSSLGALVSSSFYGDELVQKALRALYLLKKDRDYLVDKEQIQLIDANTGRTMADRSWEGGLHQMVEIKEGCPLSEKREVLARMTYQRFFRRYLRLSGMTGTAREVRAELGAVYGLRVQTIPLHRPCRRTALPRQILPTVDDKWKLVLQEIRLRHAKGQPVLVGTASVEASEQLSAILTDANVPHQVLNARQDGDEAAVVACAGQQGQVTVATNMAGRGTDIPLGPGVAELGGLHVIATSANESARIDRQLFGRCARQGDPGSYQAIYSMEDELLVKGLPASVRSRVRQRVTRKTPGHSRLAARIHDRAQRSIERLHRMARQHLLRQEQQLGKRLAFAGRAE